MSEMTKFEKDYASKINKNKIKILDIGSYDVNGTYKSIFSNNRYEYVGIDMESGPNIDIVIENPYDWSNIETNSFDIVISGQTFEHTEFFWITMSEMTRVLKENGLMCIIAPSVFVEHRFPVDCYRFLTDGMIAMARYVNLDILYADTMNNEDSILIAKKNYSGETKLVDLTTYKFVPINRETLK